MATSNLQSIPADQRGVLEALFQFYLYELSPIVELRQSDDGYFSYDFSVLDKYWFAPHHHPYFILAESGIAGFALVRQYPGPDDRYDIEQFFILAAHKRKGLGASALAQLLGKHPGDWQIRVLPKNLAAHQFWQSSIERAIGQQCTPTAKLEDNLVMDFYEFAV
ncbi:GNAT family N-acetyltransferase [Teredinibacter turnerae]|uniref:GNAT family N-acetyltransferase n=1 Tax=Teredinibacter turnerae TaxID=2426 RepID=UPI00036CFCBA|nr:GNAT family N-acetyltransferase [Teredinibacter turnerae]